MATFILSYPDTAFVPHGAQANPAAASQAFAQWLKLADEIHRAHGRILVLDPGYVGKLSSVYAALLGSSFLSPGKLPRPVFLRSNHGEPVAEDAIGRTIADAGLELRVATQPWQGQVDVIPLERNRFVITYGGVSGSSAASVEEVKALLPMGAQILTIELAPSCPRGSAAIGFLNPSSGRPVLLVSRPLLKSHTPEDLGRFLGDKVDVLIMDSDDTAAFASEALNVRGTLILPMGCSTILRGVLFRRGFRLVEVDVSALVGPAGGGPKLLTSELSGLVLSDDAPSYLMRRDRLVSLQAEYPS